MVNMDWARTHYFVPMIDSVMAGTGVIIETQVVDPTGIEFALLDQNGKAIGGRPPIPADRRPTTRRFSAYFFDPPMGDTEAVHDLEQWAWNLQVSAAEDPTLAIAVRGARRTMLVLAAGALALGIGLMIIVRATRASRRGGIDAFRVRLHRDARAEDADVGDSEHRRDDGARPRELPRAAARVRPAAGAGDLPAAAPDRQPARLRACHRGCRRLCLRTGSSRRRSSRRRCSAFASSSASAVSRSMVSAPEPLPSIRGDRTSIVFALHNLIDNAMRHAGATHIELQARLGDKAVEFVVSDRGRGIPEDELKRVQQPFVRGERHGRGSGLGLAIVRRIAAAHRGWFRLESRVDAGTTATLAIPVAAA